MNKVSIKWDDIPLKKCEICYKPISQRKKTGKRTRITPSRYKITKYCSMRCFGIGNMEQRIADGYQPWKFLNNRNIIEKPDIEILNKLFHKIRNYEKMARELNVSHQTIRRWLGTKKNLLNPKYD